ncbi:MAG TPA: hypothetical protein VML55_15420 [Planctomycetaceae bacterium]|nr:hypothetical protein [Planctomycetaceae bacterium]
MNYFAHGLRFLDRPWVLAGTAVPDWLSVADRGVRMRERQVAPFAAGAGADAELAAGILAHLEDDRWFHQTAAFYETCGDLTRLFRDALGAADGHRPGFLGHVATELLMDALLIAREPARLDRYYAALDRVDPAGIEQAVNRMARRPTGRLSMFVEIFRRERFLADYLEPPRLLFRLNQVLRRIKLNPLPESFVVALMDAREIVSARLDGLLPAERFGTALEGNLR